MKEFVLGVGHQKTILDVLKILEAELLRVEGIPRKISARGGSVGFTAERQEYEGPYETFNIRLRTKDSVVEKLLEIASKTPELCEHSSEDGYHTFVCPAPGSEDYKGARKVLVKLMNQVQLPEVWRAKGDRYRVDRVSIELLFQAMVQYKASDCHLCPGQPPIFRIDGATRVSDLMRPLSAAQISALVQEIAPDDDWKTFEKDLQCSFSFHQVGVGYTRASAFMKAGAPHLTLRFLPETIPSFADLNIPVETMEHLGGVHRGLVLITGMTGSGKTTTCASLVDYINYTKSVHILTIENPVEYVITAKKSIISQRNLGIDVKTFGMGVEGALRHDPDVIVIGEMRDRDTIRSAINAAATGHLVISTLHANSASEVVNRIVSFFDPIERDLVKLQLRDSLEAVICQRLVPKLDGGRVPAIELMFNDIKPIADGIIAGDTDIIRCGMQQTVSHSYLFETYLHDLFEKGIISLDMAREFSSDISTFDQMHMGTYTVPRVEGLKG